MMKKQKLLVSFSALFLLMACTSTGGLGGTLSDGTHTTDKMFSGKSVLITETNETFALDGELNEEFWNSSVAMDDFVTVFYSEPAPSKTSAKISYDTNGIYFAFSGDYANTDEPVDFEGITIYISPDAKIGAYATGYSAVLPLSPDTDKIILMGHTQTPNVLRLEANQYQYKVNSSEGTFTAELTIPYESLNLTGSDDLEHWKLNFVRYRPQHEGASSWAPVRTAYTQQILPKLLEDGTLVTVDQFSLYNFNIRNGYMGDVYFGEVLVNNVPVEFVTADNATLTVGDEFLLEVTHQSISETDDFSIEMYDTFGRVMEIDTKIIGSENGSVRISIEPTPLREEGLYKFVLYAPTDDKVIAYNIVFDRNEVFKSVSEIQSALLRKDTANKEILSNAPASDEINEIMNLIPEKIGYVFVGDPEAPLNARPYNLFRFDKNDPYKITSKANPDISYPNEKYPNNGVDVYTINGKTVEYPYYEDSLGKKYHLDAMLWSFQRELALAKTAEISATDQLGAARLLYRWAEVYENYAPNHDREWATYIPNDVGPPHPFWGGMWYRWWFGNLGAKYMGKLTVAFDNVDKTNAFELLSSEVGEDAREKVVAMFDDSIEYSDTYPNLNHNMDYHIWVGKALLAKALNEPDMMHETLERLDTFVSQGFLFDGFFKEVTLTYHNQSTTGLKLAIAEMDGWSDPEGYISPRTGLNIQNLDINSRYPTIGGIGTIPSKMIFPNGYYVPVTDSWGYEKYTGENADYTSMLLPAAQVARITSERDQVYLSATPKFGHYQYDTLSMIYYANDEELIPDIGYSHSYLRRWSASALAHNGVVVNSKDSNRQGDSITSGAITTYEDGDVLGVISGSNPKAYDDVSEYNRDVINIKKPDGGTYVLDLFNVVGGNRHEYTLNGPSRYETTVSTSKELVDYNDTLLPVGTEYEYPQTELNYGECGDNYYAYMYVKDVKSTQTENSDVVVTFDTGKTQMKVTNLTKGDNTLFLGDMYSLKTLRETSKEHDTPENLENDFAAKMVLRREGSDLVSTFVTLIESDADKAEEVTYVENDNGGVITIKYGNYEDSIAFSTNNEIVLDDTEYQARILLIRKENGRIIHEEKISKPIETEIIKTYRTANGEEFNGFEILDTAIPENPKTILVTHPDNSKNLYQIENVTTKNGKTLLDIGGMDTGFTVDNNTYEQNYYPLNEWSGFAQAEIR